MALLNDSELSYLMSQAQDGDRVAYEKLLTQLEHFLSQYLSRSIRQSEVRADVIQEVLIGVHKSRHTFSQDKSFSRWFLAITQYKLHDHLRQTYRNNKFEELNESFPSDEVDSLSALITAQKNQYLHEAIEGLDDRAKAIITGLKIDDKSIADLSKELELSESNIKIIAHRAYEKLRNKFKGGLN